MLKKLIYPKVETLLTRAAQGLHSLGITPNQLTLGGVALTFVAGVIFATGGLFLGGITLLIAAAGDALDGPLARSTGQSSKFGAFLDSTIDRYGDFFIFTGLGLYFVRSGEMGWFLLTLGILMGAYVTSYTKARAENMIEDCSVGIFERTERVLLVLLGTILPFLLGLVLIVLFFGTNITAIQRILHTRKVLSDQSASSEE